MRDNIYFKWFMNSLREDQKKDYREMSINQQKDWYINYLEDHYKVKKKNDFNVHNWKPKKYDRSKLNGELITNVIYDDSTGKVTIEAGEQKQDYWLDEDQQNKYSADYILCELQGETEIEVSKY